MRKKLVGLLVLLLVLSITACGKEVASLPVKELEPTTQLKVKTEEGFEWKNACLTKSKMGYEFYLLDNFVLKEGLKSRDTIYSTLDKDFFITIEKYPKDTKMKKIEKDIKEELGKIGEVEERDLSQLFDGDYKNAIGFYHSSNTSMTVNVLVMKLDNDYMKYTLHMPLKEISNGITPSYYAMLKTIRMIPE